NNSMTDAINSSQLPMSELRLIQAERAVKWGRIFIIAILVCMGGMLLRVVQLKLIPNPRLLPAVGTPISSRVEFTRRGDLLDICNRVIATSTIGYRLFIDPLMVRDLNPIALDLATLIKMDPAVIDRNISRRPDSRYVVVDQQLEDWQVEAVRKANLKGVGLEPRLIRQYPHG